MVKESKLIERPILVNNELAETVDQENFYELQIRYLYDASFGQLSFGNIYHSPLNPKANKTA